MVRHVNLEVQQLCRQFVCEKCDAQVGKPCRTEGGFQLNYEHTSRRQQLTAHLKMRNPHAPSVTGLPDNHLGLSCVCGWWLVIGHELTWIHLTEIIDQHLGGKL
jgi:hypothetical protein